MREALDQWPFVIAAYAIAITATLVLVGWSWLGMRAAERRRDRIRGEVERARPWGRDPRARR